MLSFLYKRPIYIPLLLLATSATPLALALISQYGFGLHPCELCIWQRYPYAALITIGALALIWRTKTAAFISISIVLWAVEAALAIYHVGVEQHWWISATGCTATSGGGSLADLKAQIMGAALVACDQPEFILFGLSMAGWNVLYSLGMMAALSLTVISRKRV